MAEVTPLIELEHATKRYPGVLALDDVNFTMAHGEVRALLGKNGAGKSTLIKVLGGAERLNDGTLRVFGNDTHFKGPKDAISAGIATVHQELASIPDMSVAENISLGRWPTNLGGVKWGEVKENARIALASLGLSLPLDSPVRSLSLAETQLVEIARALSMGARLLILDEPTSSLAGHEVDLLVNVIRRLSDAGIGIIYISHRMDEIRRVASSVTVMRDGRIVGDLSIADATPQRVVDLMVGDVETVHVEPRIAAVRGEVLLEVRDLAIRNKVVAANFVVHRGEVLGIAGLLGSGRTEILRAIVGAEPNLAGKIVLDGKALGRRSVRSTLAAGVVLTPEDRRAQGAVVDLSVAENLVMSSPRRVSTVGVLSPRRISTIVRDSIKGLSIKVGSPSTLVATLSGGNQQKVVIAKALNAQPKVLLMDEPTRGVDVEAKAQIYRLIRDLSSTGIGVVVVSSETEELLEVCDRILILRDGKTHEDLLVSELTRDSLFEHMMKESTND
ncbi:sugar ABC transporter ATP-binding protein [Salinibacterium sp.]|uniref:sugar ABC transporter ATP-binding protein n=1 Tax=Salinibacterium sp. TaxID=1915057 RepID=UPI00286D2841|nr:sugar ABC transporter ATP-binding protein [Salinibacterium sp.]